MLLCAFSNHKEKKVIYIWEKDGVHYQQIEVKGLGNACNGLVMADGNDDLIDILFYLSFCNERDY